MCCVLCDVMMVIVVFLLLDFSTFTRSVSTTFSRKTTKEVGSLTKTPKTLDLKHFPCPYAVYLVPGTSYGSQ